MEERDELEIETRLRAALLARSELVTHSTLRPGIPPNEHTAGVRTRREAWWSWRRLWVPVTVAAALAGGVFVGAQLPSDSDTGKVSAGSGPVPGMTGGLSQGVASTPGNTSGSTSGETPGGKPVPSTPAAGTPATVGTVDFTLADGWQVTAISNSSGCVTPKSRPAPAAARSTTSLPCGVDALYVKTDATSTAWPLSTATKDTGWWPGDVSSPSAITCPAAQPASGDMVKDSVALRSTTKYVLNAQAEQSAPLTADYHEWAVTCDDGPGVRPMLWKLNPAPGTPAPATFAVATVVSVDPEYDSALLGMVGSLHQTG